MPNNVIKSFAKKSGKSVDEVEKKWNRAKAIAAEKGHNEDYDYIVGILKNMLDLNECQNDIHSFREYLNQIEN